MRSLALVALTAALLVAGCGGGKEATSTGTTTTETTTTAPRTTTVRVYFLHGGKVWPVAREVGAPGVAGAALDELLSGPTGGERRDLALESAIPAGTSSSGVAIENGTARSGLSGDLSAEALAQVVYTLSQFPTVKAVEIGGKHYTRADFENLTPPILVESPLAWQKVGSPLRVTGTANTFEATFEYELTDTDGRIVDTHFVTATSGSGTRGTFDFTTKPYTVPFSGVGSLIVFERSAKDGSRIHLVEIPLRMEK